MAVALISVLFAALVAFVVMAGSAQATRRWWRGRAYLAPVYGILGFAAVSYGAFIAYWLVPGVALAILIGLGLAVLAYLLWSRIWRRWRVYLPLALLTVGVLVLYVGIAYLWTSPLRDFQLMAVRFSHELPIDNLIPTLFAARLQAGASTHALTGDWNGSDRPPLQAGFILFTRVLGAGVFGIDGALGASVVAQALWLPALYSCLRAWGARRKHVVIALVFVAVSGTTLLNTMYTWPKLLSAALVIASATLLLDARRHPRSFARDFVLSLLLFVFAMLAHGAAAFTAPLLIVLGVLAFRRQSPGLVVRWTAIGSAAAALLYSSWVVYQQFVDPPGDRLVKWHLGGVTVPDPRSALRVLLDSYANLRPAEWIEGRFVNLATLFGPDPALGLNCYCSSVAERRYAEFFSTSAALGVAFPLLLFVALAIVVGRLRGRTLAAGDRRYLFVVAASIGCIVVWCLVMFIPGSTIAHQGSQGWMILLLAAPVLWLAERSWPLGIIALAAQGAAMIVVYGFPSGSLRSAGLVAAFAGAGVVIAVIAAFFGPIERATAERKSR